MFVIEKGIEIPKQSRQSRTSKYPFKDMEVGDSFLIRAADRTEAQKHQRNVARAAAIAGVSVSTRLTSESDVRVWLTAKSRAKKPVLKQAA